MKLEEIKELLKSAFADFRRSKVRTILTSLGITIGILSVVLLIALGLGLKNYIEEQFQNLGTNLILVIPGNAFSEEGGGLQSFGPGFISGVEFDERDLNSLGRIPEIDLIAPAFFKSTAIAGNGERKAGYVIGTNEDFFSLVNMEILEGEVFTKSDFQSRAKKVVLGFSMAESLFGTPQEAVGKTVRFSDIGFKVIGVAKKKGDREMDNAAILPYKTTFGSINPNKTFFSLYLGVATEEEIPVAKGKAEEVLSKRYGKDEFSVTEQSEVLGTVNQIFGVINAILVAIGSISLLVGGIGIMNIMYATVTERTKEIGIRRSVGATQQDILKQFLAESVALSLMGGIAGLLLAFLIVLGIRAFFPASINFLAVSVAVVVSSTIGIFFGVFPARRAAKLPPIEAIRYE